MSQEGGEGNGRLWTIGEDASRRGRPNDHDLAPVEK
jgi:hypothetical protein